MYFIRKIRKNRWSKYGELDWLPAGDISADPLGDLATNQHAFSLWKVEDDKNNLDRVIVALAAKTQSLANFDYLLFAADVLDDLDVEITQAPGESFDDEANDLWHFEVYPISASMLVEVARHLYHAGQPLRKQKKELAAIVQRVAEDLARCEVEQLKLHWRREPTP